MATWPEVSRRTVVVKRGCAKAAIFLLPLQRPYAPILALATVLRGLPLRLVPFWPSSLEEKPPEEVVPVKRKYVFWLMSITLLTVGPS
jgi:hypothetical protein